MFVEVLSENVVAMVTREGLSSSFVFKTSSIYFSEKSQGFKKKILSFLSYAPKSLKGITPQS